MLLLLLSQRAACRRLSSSLISPPMWTPCRAAAATTTAMLPRPPPRRHINENIEINRRLIMTRAVAETSQSTNYSLRAYGAAASAAILYHQSNRDQHNSHQKWGRRFQTAHCESNENNYNNNQKQQNDPQGKGGDSDSFFDLAQQWASEVLLSKSNSPSPGEDSSGTKVESNSVSPPTEIDTPEGALLYKLGLLGNKSTYDPPTSKGRSTDSNNKPNNTSVKQMMQSVFSKIQDEIQSSIPKTSSSTDQASSQLTKPSSSNQQYNSDDAKSSDFLSFSDSISSFFSRKSSNPDIAEIIKQAQNIANNDNTSSIMPSSLSSSGFLSQVIYFQKNAKSIQKTLESSFGPYIPDDINLSDLIQSIPNIAALHYYLEYQESIKTPSWKRRRHRFQPSVEVMKVNELNEALMLSELSYADSVEEVRAGLESLYDVDRSGDDNGKSMKEKGKISGKAQWELLFCDTQSRPNEPSHFLAIQKNASDYDDTLHVLMVVRGTKSMSDLITDAMMEATDYEYNGVHGEAHSGMTRAGDYLTKRHVKLLATLLHLSDKRKLDITLVGHSMGAGAATIAAMNMNSDQFRKDIGNGGNNNVKVSANVIGFGCPALLSQNLSLMTRNFVTTVIADADVIPRSELNELLYLCDLDLAAANK